MTRQLNVRLDGELLEALRAECLRQQISQQEAVATIIRRWLDDSPEHSSRPDTELPSDAAQPQEAA